MKMKFTFLAALLVLTTSLVSAQTKSESTDYNKWYIDANLGFAFPERNFSPGFDAKSFKSNTYGLGLRYMANEYFGLKLDYSHYALKDGGKGYDFKTDYTQFAFLGVVNLGRVLKFESWTQKFGLLAYAGPTGGWFKFDENINDEKDRVIGGLAGVTLQCKVSPRISINLSGDINTNDRNQTAYDGGTSTAFEFLSSAKLGISIALGKNKTSADWYVAANDMLDKEAALEQRLAAIDRKLNTKANADQVQEVVSGVNQAKQKIGSIEQQLAEIKKNTDGINKDEIVFATVNSGFIDVYFDLNSAQVSDKARSELSIIKNYMSKHPKSKVCLVGYAGKLGTQSYNLKLSRKRAEAVAAVLKEIGIDDSRIITSANGENNNFKQETSNTNKYSRKVEVSLIK